MTLVHQPRPRKESVIFDDVLPEDLPRPELTDNARIVLGKRYLKKDADGEPIDTLVPAAVDRYIRSRELYR